MKTSWKTTVAGIAIILTSLGGALTALTDNNPATNPDWVQVATSIAAGLGLAVARDNNKSDESAGAKPDLAK